MDELLEKYDYVAWDTAWYLVRRTGCFWALREHYTNALEGVWIGLKEWDGSREVPLEKYVRVKARHTAVDQMRRETHLKRGAQLTLKKIDEAKHQFMQEHRRNPDEIELAEIIGVTEGRILRSMAAKRRQSFHDSNDDFDDDLLNLMGCTEDTVEQDVAISELLDDMTKGLYPREKLIVSLRAIGYTNKEVGEKLGIQESRVCQIRHQIAELLTDKAA